MIKKELPKGLTTIFCNGDYEFMDLYLNLPCVKRQQEKQKAFNDMIFLMKMRIDDEWKSRRV